MLKIIWTALCVTVLSTPGARAEESIVAQLAIEWTQAPNKESIANMYAEDAVLWGTSSKEMIVGRSKIMNYFVEATSKYPGMKSEIQDGIITKIYGDTATNTSMYKIENTVHGAILWSIFGRFTFTYNKIDGEWLIIAHHSSVLPQ